MCFDYLCASVMFKAAFIYFCAKAVHLFTSSIFGILASSEPSSEVVILTLSEYAIGVDRVSSFL